MTRQAAHRHLARLLDEGKLEREGRTRGVLYRVPGPGSKRRRRVLPRYHRSFTMEGLQEDLVLAEIAAGLALQRELTSAAYRIFAYGFTEMLNNAIEHSHSSSCAVDVDLAPRDVRAVIRDQGIGVFGSIASRMGLRDESDAVGELLKGKATTMPERHSGQGIFFTSRACDSFVLRSHRIELVMGARTEGAAVYVRRLIRGTEVALRVSRSSRRDLAAVFAEFAPEDYDFRFEKSIVTVRLSAREYVSRSEARRLLARLDQFREITFDFAGVRSIGQAFADEIFRVFPLSHPQIVVSRSDVDPAIEAVIRSVVDNRR